MGVKLGLSHSVRNNGRGCTRFGAQEGGHLGLRGTR